jgi:YjbE family integral membrane protein
MLQWLSEISWVAVGQIIMIDLLLGGDNAVVIALACRNLPPAQRTKGIILGTAGAIVLRVILVLFAVALLKIPFLKLIGGLLLIWIGIKLLMPEDEGEDGVASPDHLWGAVRTVIVADLVMSVDNVIAIAGAAEQAAGHHQTGLVIFGLLVSIPIIVFGSQIVLKLMDRFPVVILLGAGLLGWIAGSLILGDPAVQQLTGPLPASAAYVAGGVGAAFVMLLGRWLAARKSRAHLGA